jgi:hypothetical protein
MFYNLGFDGTLAKFGIGTTNPASMLDVNFGITTIQTVINAITSINDFGQFNIQNLSTGTAAQSGYAATADNGTATSGFAWMGINNSTFSNPQTYNIGAANDVSFMGSGQDMYIANANQAKSIIFSTGKSTTPFFNERMRITNAGNVGIGTTAPDTSAILDMSGATTKGMLPPKVSLASLTDVTTIATPATGLLVWNTNASLLGGVGYYYNAGTTTSAVWVQIGGTPVGLIDEFAGAVGSGYLLCDGTAKSRTTYANLFKYLVTDAGFTSQTFTVTIANPAVFSKTGHNFTGGERTRLSTTGALPTGLVTTIDYYVIYVSANTYQLSTTLGGTPVATSGTQSGTHSYMQSLYGLGDGSTTFNVPDYRGQFLRGLDAGAGIDTGRTLGTRQADMFASHTHVMNSVQPVAGGTSSWTPTVQNTTNVSLITLATGGTETRPKNIAVNYGIKY